VNGLRRRITNYAATRILPAVSKKVSDRTVGDKHFAGLYCLVEYKKSV